MKARALAVAVFRSLATRTSSSGEPARVADLIADVSISSPEGALVERGQLDNALTLLVRSKLIRPAGESLQLTAEGEQFWRRVSHLEPPGMKKWIREAVVAYSRGDDLRWETTDQAWADARVLFVERHRRQIGHRLEVLDGLLAAMENWHFVSTLIAGAADRSAAVAALQGTPFLFSKVQAQEVVEMRLSQRTALGRLSLSEERDAIRAELEELAEGKSMPRESGPEPRHFPREVVALERRPEPSRVAG